MSVLKQFIASSGLMVAAAGALQAQDRNDPVVENLKDTYKLSQPVRRTSPAPDRVDHGMLVEVDLISDDGATTVKLYGNDPDHDGLDPQDVYRIQIKQNDPEAPGADTHTGTTTILTKGSKTVTQWSDTPSETYAMPAGYANVKGHNVHEDIKTTTTSDQAFPICSDAVKEFFKAPYMPPAKQPAKLLKLKP